MKRAKKTKKVPEQTTRAGPIRIRKDALIAAMRRLVASEDYGLLRSLWLSKRGEHLENGKAKPSEAAWSVLKGFDDAILCAEIWAAKETKEDSLNSRADALQASLANDSEGS